MKTVSVLGYNFDCLPGHIKISGRGSGQSVRVAAARAMDNMLCDERLSHKRINDFKVSVVVIADRKVDE